jgi:hypothetical protein
MTPPLLSMQGTFQQHMLGTADARHLLAGTDARRALGLGIYAHAYRRRLVDALADAYAKTSALLGAAQFDAAALRYIAEQPPGTRNLRWYGADFADHLHEPAASEMARLDWALRGAFDGPDSMVIEAEELAALAAAQWATLRLVPVPTTQLLRFKHNTVAVWQALDDDADAPPSAEAGTAVHWLVWRKALQPHFRSMHPSEATLLRAMLGGASFAQACEQCQGESADAAFIGQCLRQWLDDALIAAVVLAAPQQGPQNCTLVPQYR